MDSPEPDTPFAAVTAQTTKYGRVGYLRTAWRVRLPFTLGVYNMMGFKYTDMTNAQ
jgi:hypothetical protein